MDNKWKKRGKCVDEESKKFFHNGRIIRRNGSPTEELTTMTELAMTLCKVCPVKRQCLNEAIEDPHALGLWGGEIFTYDPTSRNLLARWRLTGSMSRSHGRRSADVTNGMRIVSVRHR